MVNRTFLALIGFLFITSNQVFASPTPEPVQLKCSGDIAIPSSFGPQLFPATFTGLLNLTYGPSYLQNGTLDPNKNGVDGHGFIDIVVFALFYDTVHVDAYGSKTVGRVDENVASNIWFMPVRGALEPITPKYFFKNANTDLISHIEFQALNRGTITNMKNNNTPLAVQLSFIAYYTPAEASRIGKTQSSVTTELQCAN